MKFTDGYWHAREGYVLHHPIEIRDFSAGPGTLAVHAACRQVVRRGDTLNAPLLSYEFTAPRPDTIRVRIRHFAGGVGRGPDFGAPEPGFLAESSVGEEFLSLRSGRLEVRVMRTLPLRIEYRFDGTRVARSGPKSAAYIEAPDGAVYFREQMDLGVDERVYGLGERFGPFVKNGQSVDCWNEDGGTSSEQAYKNLPFYVTSRGYGVLANHPEKVSFEVGSENVERVQFSVPGEGIDYVVVGGPDLRGVLANYTALTGRPALPPAWSFGLWLTTSFTTSYDETTVNSFIDGMRERDLPLHVFHFDCFWMKEYQWCDFTWDPDVFPDPVGMLRRLKDRGLRICVWINSYIAQKSPLFAEGKAAGHLLKRPDGSVWQWDRWQAGMALVDFTSPSATAWFQGKLEALLDMGIDCFKTDFGERIPTDVVYADGSDPLRMHNYYTLLYNRAVFELLERKRGRGEAVLFARSATVGGQRFPAHWGGDSTASYESMAETLRGGLSLALGGFGFWSHDISGFERTATPDLFKRWCAFGLLSSHSRLHGSESYRVPWLFDEEAVDVLRFFTKLKCRLMPYLFDAACKASESGIPLLRPMVLEFPDDPACRALDLQYMLGGSLLVAPVFSETGEVEFYLPEGIWTRLLTGETVEGGRWLRERYGYESLPLLVRPGTLLAVGAIDDRPDYDFAKDTIFHLFELAEGGTATATVRRMDGTEAGRVEAVREGGRVRIHADGDTRESCLVECASPIRIRK